MSGGSLDYVYCKVEDAASRVRSMAETPLQRAFAEHLYKVSKALHDLEWVLSCDYSQGQEVEAIMACVTPADVLNVAVDRALRAKADVEGVIALYAPLQKEPGGSQ
jgi:hypothetical protein